MPTQNHPHINDDVLKALDDGNLIYLDKNDEDACSFVVRLAPTVVNSESLPLRFEKRAKPNRDGILDTQVINEGDIFNRMQTLGINIDKIVNRLKYSQESNGNYVLVTESVGLDADRWQSIPLYFNGGLYQHIFCHPLVLLHFIKGTILGLKSIHQHKLYHCDIRADQICIPFTKNKKNITVNPDKIKLIDFGIAIYKMNPVITHNPVRFNSKNMPEGDYVATALIKAGDHQRYLYQTTGEYNFNQLINQIDCAVDLYSLGFLLNSLEINKLSADIKLWNSFEQEYLQWLKELLSLSDKTTPFKENLPHDQYIHQVDQWIKNVQQLSGLTIDQLVFGLENTKPIPYKPTGTPTPPHEDDDSSIAKRNNYTVESIIIIIEILMVVGYVIFTKDHPQSITSILVAHIVIVATVSMIAGCALVFTNFKFDYVDSFSDGLARVKKNGKWGFIDKTDQVVIDFEFDDADGFSEGLARVKKDGKWGFIDKTGQMVTGFEFDYAGGFSEGLARVKKNKYGYIDKTGQIVIDFGFKYAKDFSNGFACVNKNGKLGFIDKTGQMVTGFEFNYADNFSDGLARVKKDGKWGFIDKTGQMVTGFEFNYADNFSDGLARVEKNGKWGFIDKTGQMVTGFEFNYAKDFSNGFACVKKNKYGYIDKTGQMVIDFEYDDARNFSKGLASVKKDGVWHYIDQTGKIVASESDF